MFAPYIGDIVLLPHDNTQPSVATSDQEVRVGWNRDNGLATKQSGSSYDYKYLGYDPGLPHLIRPNNLDVVARFQIEIWTWKT